MSEPLYAARPFDRRPADVSKSGLRARPYPLAMALASASLLTLAHDVSRAQVATLPTGATVVHGQAAIATAGNRMTVTNSNNAILNWRTFSIGAGQAVQFDQPNASSQVLNRVLGNDPSKIFGSLSSNGKVWLLNPNGVLFGKGARVDVAGLVASTLNLNDGDWLAGRYQFGPGTGALGDGGAIINQGELRTTLGGRIALLASAGGVRNEGLIEAPEGQVILAAGQSIDLVDTGAPNIAIRITAPQGEALNLGSVLASGGRIDVQAAIVNQNGIVRADALEAGVSGDIVLRATQALNLAAGSVTSANGPTGGRVLVDASDGTNLVRGEISARGSAGQGGAVRVLGHHVGIVDAATVDASGQAGGGEVLIGGGQQGRDPQVPNAEAAFVGPNAVIAADSTGLGNGGRVILWSDKATRAYGSFSARGGPHGGNGGLVETSGGWLDAQPTLVNTTARDGKAGQWLLDPDNIDIVTNFCTSFCNPNTSEILTSTVASALVSGNNVSIATSGTGANSGDINLYGNLNVSLNSAATFELHAYRNIYIAEDIRNTGPAPLGVTLSSADSGVNRPDALGTVTIRGNIITGGGDIRIGGRSLITGSGSSEYKWAVGSPNEGDENGISFIPFPSTVLNAGSGRIELNGATTSGLSGGVHVNSLDVEGVGTTRLIARDIVINGYASTGNSVAFDGPVDSTGFSVGLLSTQSIQVSGANIFIGNGAQLNSGGTVDIRTNSLRFQGSAQVSANGAGNAIVVAGFTGNTATFENNAGVNALSAPNGRWLVYSASNPVGDDSFVSGGLRYDFKQYNSVFGTSDSGSGPPPAAGNGFLFSTAPAVSLSGAPSKVYDGTTAATLSGSTVAVLSGLIPGDEPVIGLTVSGNFVDRNARDAIPILFDVTSGGGGISFRDSSLKPVYGYTLSQLSGTIARAPLTLSADIANKIYDTNANATIKSVTLSGLVGVETLAITANGSFDNPNVIGAGLPKPVAVNVALTGGTNGGIPSNYTAPTVIATTAIIFPATLTYVADPVIGFLGSPLPTLSGHVTGFVGQETQPSATSGSLQFSAPPNAQASVGTYAIQGSGLSASNYMFVQSTSNAAALKVVAPVSGPQDAQRELSNSVPQVDLPLQDPPKAPDRVRDVFPARQPGPTDSGMTFTSKPWSKMSEGDVATLLAARDSYKFNLFGPALEKLEKDPGLADVQSCKTVAQVETGTCLITEALKREIVAARSGSALTDRREPLPTAPPAPAAPTAGAPQVLTMPRASIPDATRPTQPGASPVASMLANRRAVRNAALPQIERKVAVLIGLNDYADKRIPQLDNAVGDARAVAKVFETSLGYEVVVIENGSKESIIRALNRVAAEVGPRDSVIVYYAGHGAVVPATGLGYWQPSNADASKPETWISNSDIGKLIAQFGASQVALISDSCFSGELVSADRIRASTAAVDPNALLSRRAAVAMSSGGNEPVSDEGKQGHSPFAWSLMESVQQVPTWQVGGNVFERVRFAVAKELPQRPRYGAAPLGGHQAGSDYLFERRQLGAAQ